MLQRGIRDKRRFGKKNRCIIWAIHRPLIGVAKRGEKKGGEFRIWTSATRRRDCRTNGKSAHGAATLPFSIHLEKGNTTRDSGGKNPKSRGSDFMIKRRFEKRGQETDARTASSVARVELNRLRREMLPNQKGGNRRTIPR